MYYHFFIKTELLLQISENIGNRILSLEVQRLLLVVIIVLLIAFLVIQTILKRKNLESRLEIEFSKKYRPTPATMAEAYFKGQDDERMRISKELHDGVCSGLVGVRFLIEPFTYDNEDLKKASIWLQSIHTDLRYISHNLASKEIIDNGLADAIELLLSRMCQKNGVHFNFQSKFDNNLPELSFNIQQNAYRIVQEILINILKHSKANAINLVINLSNEYLIIEITDNAANNGSMKSKGLGLGNISSRVQFLRGKIAINSSEAGTYYKISFPLKPPHTSNPSTVTSSD